MILFSVDHHSSAAVNSDPTAALCIWNMICILRGSRMYWTTVDFWRREAPPGNMSYILIVGYTDHASISALNIFSRIFPGDHTAVGIGDLWEVPLVFYIAAVPPGMWIHPAGMYILSGCCSCEASTVPKCIYALGYERVVHAWRAELVVGSGPTHECRQRKLSIANQPVLLTKNASETISKPCLNT